MRDAEADALRPSHEGAQTPNGDASPPHHPRPAMRRRLKARARAAAAAGAASAIAAMRTLEGERYSASWVAEKRHRTAILVARFGADPVALAPLLAAIEPRAVEVRRLDTVAPTEVPASAMEALRRVVRGASVGAAGGGALGALLGSLAIAGEALLPSLGWVPGPIVGGALGAGALGVLGFVVAATVLLLSPSATLHRRGATGTLVVVRARPFDVEAIIARLVEAGGVITAVGED